MSFTITSEKMRNRTKTVTRRMGWWFLKTGDIVNAVEKSRGLKKGEKIKHIGQIRIINTGPEALSKITGAEVVREGFSEMFTEEFIRMFCATHKGCLPDTIINRIEFEHI